MSYATSVRRAFDAGRSMGKTTLTTAHMVHELRRLYVEGPMRRTDWDKPIGGLHKERWDAYDPDAITRLGDLAREDRHE